MEKSRSAISSAVQMMAYPAATTTFRRGESRVRWVWAMVAVAVQVCGCGAPREDFHEVVRLDDPFGEEQVAMLERVAGRMEDGRLPEMTPHFLPPPEWPENRPASVADLAREELERLRHTQRLSTLAESLGKDPRLLFALKDEGLTIDQYVALVLAVGLALQKAERDPVHDLATYVKVGRAELAGLKNEAGAFTTLFPQERADALDRAAWVTRVDRAERLLKVPAGNAAFAADRRERLVRILPHAFLDDPLSTVSVPLLDRGVPFTEQSDSGYDGDLYWSPQDERAVIGDGEKADRSLADETDTAAPGRRG